MNRLMPKSEWGPGPWQDEPDRVEWRTAVGMPALMRRGTGGVRCGYVAVAPGHPLHGVDYGVPDVEEAHGGLTFAGECRGEVCHVPEPGEPDNVWWFGFDCAHAGDYSPESEAFFREKRPSLARGLGVDATYRDAAYVRSQCESLARQLAASASGIDYDADAEAVDWRLREVQS